MKIINIAHVLIGIFLLYIAIKRDIHNGFYYILLALGIISYIYHIYKYYITGYWLYLFHIIILLPLIIIIGILQNKSPDALYQILLFLAFGVIGYHSYSILKDQLNIYHSSILAIILIILFV
jgi:hypothetical protein